VSSLLLILICHYCSFLIFCLINGLVNFASWSIQQRFVNFGGRLFLSLTYSNCWSFKNTYRFLRMRGLCFATVLDFLNLVLIFLSLFICKWRHVCDLIRTWLKLLLLEDTYNLVEAVIAKCIVRNFLSYRFQFNFWKMILYET
jgi:hypothetical protein